MATSSNKASKWCIRPAWPNEDGAEKHSSPVTESPGGALMTETKVAITRV